MVRLLLWGWAQDVGVGDRGVEGDAALRDFGGALRHEPQHVFWRHPFVASGRPRALLANDEGPLGHKNALTRAILREDGLFCKGGATNIGCSGPPRLP
jgi:hypothetical protein